MISNVEISGIHYEVTDELKKYVMRKIAKLDKYALRHARKSITAVVKLAELKTKSDRNQCEVILHLPEQQLTAKAATINMIAAVDIVESKIHTQLKKYKELHSGNKHDHRGLLRRLRRSNREA